MLQRLCTLLLCFALWLPAAAPRPKEVLGFEPGEDYKLADYAQITGYFQKLAASTDRMRLVAYGKTSMGRTSALILVCLPFCLAALMTLISPSYMSPFYTTSTGHFLMGFCLVSMAMGGLLLKRIVNVRY